MLVQRKKSVEVVDKYRNTVRELERAKVGHVAVSGVLPVMGKILPVWQLIQTLKVRCAEERVVLIYG